MHECSVKYKAAKSAGTLGGMNWKAFRKAECGASAAVAPAQEPTATGPNGSSGTPMTTGLGSSSGAPPKSTATPSVNIGNAEFPTAVSPKYAKESAGRARMHTCLDQYRLNKTSGGNGNLKWIQKGGGYYSECNKRLSQQ
jgi:hypothetical protein